MPFDATPYAGLAESLGAHALAAYLIALPVLMLGVTSVWWLARRYAMPRDDSQLPPSAYLLVRLAFGFAVMIAGAMLFAELAEQLADAGAAERMGALDALLSAAVGNHLNATARQAFATITHLADTATLAGLTVVVAGLLLAFQRRWLALAYVGAVAGNALLNVALKNIFERTRPIHDTTLFQPHGWSFPSGHSSGAVVAYGMLAYVLVRTWPPVKNHAFGSLAVVLAASALAFTIGCSRIFIQVHYATDVLAGFSSGSMWLAMCIISMELTRHYQRRR
ncbi:MAG: phosphatase PAP2 family protein [Polaromonas sp.]|nr:phosphatase PAP2 family protein [Polaromonas sp.]